MSTKRDGQQGAGLESGLTHKEKIGKQNGGSSGKMDNYRPKKPSSKARDGHTIK